MAQELVLNWYHYLLISAVGLAAGFINVTAGGGSLLTVPTMIFLGLPPAMANGTNRIAQVAQNSTAVYRFSRDDVFPWQSGLLLGVVAAAGAVIGSRIAVDIPGYLFNRLLAAVMIMVLVLTLTRRRAGEHQRPQKERWRWLIPAFLLVGIYGGFVQAGVGVLIMALYSRLGNKDLVQTNALKGMVILIYTLPALAVFTLHGQVHWGAGLWLAVGQAAGAWLAARCSVRGGEAWIRAFLTLAVLAMAARLLWLTV